MVVVGAFIYYALVLHFVRMLFLSNVGWDMRKRTGVMNEDLYRWMKCSKKEQHHVST